MGQRESCKGIDMGRKETPAAIEPLSCAHAHSCIRPFRWFVLSGQQFRYYPSGDKMKEPLGEIDLSKVIEIHREHMKDGPSDQRFMFSIETPVRELPLRE